MFYSFKAAENIKLCRIVSELNPIKCGESNKLFCIDFAWTIVEIVMFKLPLNFCPVLTLFNLKKTGKEFY